MRRSNKRARSKERDAMADNNASDNSSGKGSSSRGNAAPSNKADAASPTVEPTVESGRSRFLVAAPPLAGVQPMAVDAIATTLNNMPDVQIIKQVKPSGFGALSAG